MIIVWIDFMVLISHLADCLSLKLKGARPRASRGLPTKVALHETRKAAPGGRVPWPFVHRKPHVNEETWSVFPGVCVAANAAQI
jgi:hypothetical protein